MNLRLLSLLSLWSISTVVSAGVLYEQNLHFGTIAIIDNNSVSELTVPVAGNSLSTNRIFILQQGQPAIMRFVSYPAYTELSFSPILPVQSGNPVAAPEKLTITQVLMPSTATTDVNGEVVVNMGAVMQTSGSGQQYVNTTYSFTIYLTVTY